MSAPGASAHAARYFEDMVVGEVCESGTHAVSSEELVAFASRYDPQWFHVDPEAARSSIFGELIASGIHTMALWRLLDHEISRDVRWICGVAWNEVRWPNPVRAGDVLRARTEILDKRLSRSEAGRGIVECRYTLLNQRGEIVFTCQSVNLIETRPSESRSSDR